jgi:hypothetical protein
VTGPFHPDFPGALEGALAWIFPSCRRVSTVSSSMSRSTADPRRGANIARTETLRAALCAGAQPGQASDEKRVARPLLASSLRYPRRRSSPPSATCAQRSKAIRSNRATSKRGRGTVLAHRRCGEPARLEGREDGRAERNGWSRIVLAWRHSRHCAAATRRSPACASPVRGGRFRPNCDVLLTTRSSRPLG